MLLCVFLNGTSQCFNKAAYDTCVDYPVRPGTPVCSDHACENCMSVRKPGEAEKT
jgi:hypothetical protein